MLVYIEESGRFIPGIPSGDLTDAEAAELETKFGWEKGALVASGCYKHVSNKAYEETSTDVKETDDGKN